MPKKPLEEIYNELETLMETGTEEDVKKFVIANLNEFPEKERGEILMGFFEDSLVKEKEDLDLLTDFQQKGLDVLKGIDAEKKALEDRDRLLEMKESL